MSGAQEQKLKETYQRLKKEDGLQDIKFCFAPGIQEATPEKVCASVNAVLDAIRARDVEKLPPLGDSHRKA